MKQKDNHKIDIAYILTYPPRMKKHVVVHVVFFKYKNIFSKVKYDTQINEQKYLCIYVFFKN